ncbi:MAG: ribosomal RNA small subunit methyltransferase A [Sphingobacteriaceae bacterium]|nr:ribosomal RNA small subunit methyltransferase A [Sphingobacteriaceae bacterium]
MNGKVRPKKQLGQHFLTDQRTAQRIAQTLTGYGDYKTVIEVGPGTGMLTQFLQQQPYQLILSEVDQESIDYLIAEKGFHSSDFIGDFLKIDPAYLSREPMAITGNFPYNISTQIVFKVIEHRSHIPEMTGMFQREVAQRICAGPGGKDYGILSVLTQAFYHAEYLFTVNEGVFNPPPKVKSGVIRLQRLPKAPSCDTTALFRVVKTAFNQRRKMLGNALKPVLPENYTDELGVLQKRAEQLSVADFIALTNHLQGG